MDNIQKNQETSLKYKYPVSLEGKTNQLVKIAIVSQLSKAAVPTAGRPLFCRSILTSQSPYRMSLLAPTHTYHKKIEVLNRTRTHSTTDPRHHFRHFSLNL